MMKHDIVEEDEEWPDPRVRRGVDKVEKEITLQDIYNLLVKMSIEMNKMEQRLEKKIDKLEERFDQLDHQVETIGNQVGQLLNKSNKIAT